MVSSLRSGRNVSFRVLDVDWCTSDKVILASDDGCIRVLEMTMKPACFRMDEQELSGMVKLQSVPTHPFWGGDCIVQYCCSKMGMFQPGLE